MRLQVGSLIAALLCVAVTEGAAAAQTPGNAPALSAAAEHRQFDFWIGQWDVADPAGAFAGKNRITRVLSGCVLLEELTGAGGGQASSYGGVTWTTAFDGT